MVVAARYQNNCNLVELDGTLLVVLIKAKYFKSCVVVRRHLVLSFFKCVFWCLECHLVPLYSGEDRQLTSPKLGNSNQNNLDG